MEKDYKKWFRTYAFLLLPLFEGEIERGCEPLLVFLQKPYTFWIFCSLRSQNISKGLAKLQVFASHPFEKGRRGKEKTPHLILEMTRFFF